MTIEGEKSTDSSQNRFINIGIKETKKFGNEVEKGKALPSLINDHERGWVVGQPQK